MNSTKIKYITLIVVIFVVGAALGFLGGQTYQKSITPKEPRSRGNFQQRYTNNLKSELNLTEEQSKKINEILAKSRKETQGEFKPVWDKIREKRKEVEKEIESILTAEQKVKYQALRKKQERDFSRHRRPDRPFSSKDTTSKRSNK